MLTYGKAQLKVQKNVAHGDCPGVASLGFRARVFGRIVATGAERRQGAAMLLGVATSPALHRTVNLSTTSPVR